MRHDFFAEGDIEALERKRQLDADSCNLTEDWIDDISNLTTL